ncbi:MAG: DUF1015 domain-containing protein [Clostridiales bacterium]|nr:DUF1015 domain-containing protein [Clostridiales bacterium]
MNPTQTVFSSAAILLPPFSSDPESMKRWAVIACDQFTSEPAYWKRCRDLACGHPSAYDYIMPEAYLGTEEEAVHAAEIEKAMASFDERIMRRIDGFLYLERTLPDGSLRRGIVGRIDLEAYDYRPGSSSPIRATEATVLERIPPRTKIRASAAIELPHILVLVDDRVGLMEKAASLAREIAYDFDLMAGGGHARGTAIEGQDALLLSEKIAEYESSRAGLVYAMGDGNHSLAAARAHWENVKRETGDMDHPARYALCEITALGEESLVFEPIYRLLKNCDPDDVFTELLKVSAESGEQRVEIIAGERGQELSFARSTHALTVGTLQDWIDRYLAAHPGVICDYIHGEESLRGLASAPGNVGFLFEGMDKSALFPYVESHGTLPRKTFSMGDAAGKRYYIECRRIRR